MRKVIGGRGKEDKGGQGGKGDPPSPRGRHGGGGLGAGGGGLRGRGSSHGGGGGGGGGGRGLARHAQGIQRTSKTKHWSTKTHRLLSRDEGVIP